MAPKYSFPDLTHRPSRPASAQTTLTKLRSLAATLREIDQDDADRNSFLSIAKQVAHSSLLKHKDGGVRAWTMICMVELFRLCAPDAPFQNSELKTFFTELVDSLVPHLANPAHAYNEQHMFVLKSLAEVKSIVLLTDIDPDGHLLSQMFNSCFDVLAAPKLESGEERSKNVEHHMTIILQTLVEELEGSIPSDVIDVVLAQFLRADPMAFSGRKAAASDPTQQSLLLMREAPAAYQMAKNLCNAVPSKMARGVGSYFAALALELEEHADNELSELSKAHRLVRELWRGAPDVLIEVVPQLENELQVENSNLRLLATETVADMLAGIGAAGAPSPKVSDPSLYPSQFITPEKQTTYDFLTTPACQVPLMSQHATVYHMFLGRVNDKHTLVRASCASGVSRILATAGGGLGLDRVEEARLVEVLATALCDGEEKVRIAAIQGIGQLELPLIIRLQIAFEEKRGFDATEDEPFHPESFLSRLADRAKDKKIAVRLVAIQVLGQLWGLAADAIGAGDRQAQRALGPLASFILESYYLNDSETIFTIYEAVFESLVPIQYPRVRKGAAESEKEKTKQNADSLRAKRILVLVAGLRPKAKCVFMALQSNQPRFANLVMSIIGTAEKLPKGDSDGMLQKQLDVLCASFRRVNFEPSQIEEWRRFIDFGDRRSFMLIRFATDSGSEYSRVAKSIAELQRRLTGNATGLSGSMSIWDTVRRVLFRGAVLVFNRSHLPTVFTFARDGGSELTAAAHDIVKEVTLNTPGVVRAHAEELSATVMRESDEASDNLHEAIFALKACSSYARKFPGDLPQDSTFVDSLMRFVEGRGGSTAGKAAKWAATILISIATEATARAKMARKIVRMCLSFFEERFVSDEDGAEALKSETAGFVGRLAALSYVLLEAGSDIGPSDSENLAEVAGRVLSLKLDDDGEAEEGSGSSSDSIELTGPVEAKLWALRLLVNQIKGTAKSRSKVASSSPPETDVSTVLALLSRLISSPGFPGVPLPASAIPGMRLAAAKLSIQLASLGPDILLAPKDVVMLATVIQDPRLPVREGFYHQLMRALGKGDLPVDYYAILALLAFEPFERIRETAVQFLHTRVTSRVVAGSPPFPIDAVFARLISILSHHPDFDLDDHESVVDTAKYITFALDGLATDENLSTIFHMSQRVRTVGDGLVPLPEAGSTDEEYQNSSKALYTVSDLALLTIRTFADVRGWNAPQAMTGTVKLPQALFTRIPNSAGRSIAASSFISAETATEVEQVVRTMLRKKREPRPPKPRPAKPSSAKKKVKRRRKKDEDEDEDEDSADRRVKARTTAGGDLTPRRRSSRQVKRVGYAESDESESGEDDDEEEEEDEETNDATKMDVDSDSVRSLTPVSEVEGDKKAVRATTGKPTKTAPKLSGDEEDDEELSELSEAEESDDAKEKDRGRTMKATMVEVTVPSAKIAVESSARRSGRLRR